MNFDQMEKRYRELVAQRQAGLLGPRQFEDLVAGLRLQDAQHRWWQLDPASGQWLTWNGSNWQPGTPAASGLPSNGDSVSQQAVAFVQSLWRRFLARLITPGEFLRQGRLPMAQRSQGWWDVASIAGGALSGYVWFLYSSIRGMPHFKLLGMNGGRDVWYDFLPSLLLAAIPMLLFAYRGRILARLDRVWTPISASASYAMQLGAGVIVLAMVLNYFSPTLFGWAFAFREGLDFTTPLLMVGIPVALAIFRPETDQLLAPMQPIRGNIPKFLLVGVAIAIPYALAFLLYRLSFNQYELLHWNLALGIIIPYVLLRNPPPDPRAIGAGRASLMSVLSWVLPAMLVLMGFYAPEARADDCVRDLFNLRDCLRTGGYAEIMSGTAASVVSILVNGSDIVRIFLLPPESVDAAIPNGQPPAGDGVLQDPRAELDRINRQWQEASQGIDPKDPGYNDFKKSYDDYIDSLKNQIAVDDAQRAAATTPVPQTPTDIEWTSPDGRNNVLVWNPQQNGYINVLTGGFVASGDVGKWKDNITQNLGQTEEWRKRNADLAASGRDAMSQALKDIADKYKAQQAQNQADANKQRQWYKDFLKADMDRNRALAEGAIRTANSADKWLNRAEWVVTGADVSINVLSTVTGNKSVKVAYTVIKDITKHISAANAEGKSLAGGLIKGAVEAGFDLGFDRLKSGGRVQNIPGFWKFKGSKLSGESLGTIEKAIAMTLTNQPNGTLAKQTLIRNAFRDGFKSATQSHLQKVIIKDPAKRALGLK